MGDVVKRTRKRRETAPDPAGGPRGRGGDRLLLLAAGPRGRGGPRPPAARPKRGSPRPAEIRSLGAPGRRSGRLRGAAGERTPGLDQLPQRRRPGRPGAAQRRARGGRRRLASEDGLVSALNVTSEDGGERPMTRLVVATRQEVEHAVSADGARLQLRLVPVDGERQAALAPEPVPARPNQEPASLAPEPVAPEAVASTAPTAPTTPIAPIAPTIEPEQARLTPPAEPAPVPQPVTRVGTPDEPAVGPALLGAAATRLEDIQVLASDGRAVIRIAGDGEFPYATFALSEPARFVIDLSGVVNRASRSTLALDGSVVERVRVGQFKPPAGAGGARGLRPAHVDRAAHRAHRRGAGGDLPRRLAGGRRAGPRRGDPRPGDGRRARAGAGRVGRRRRCVPGPAAAGDRHPGAGSAGIRYAGSAGIRIGAVPAVRARAGPPAGRPAGGVRGRGGRGAAGAAADSDSAGLAAFGHRQSAERPPVAPRRRHHHGAAGRRLRQPGPRLFRDRAQVRRRADRPQGHQRRRHRRAAHLRPAQGLNIIVQPGVTGLVTAELENVPWDQALEQMLQDQQARLRARGQRHAHRARPRPCATRRASASSWRRPRPSPCRCARS